MKEDNLYLLIGYLLLGVTVLILTLKSKNKLRILRVNLIIVGLYSGLFLYKLNYSNSGGSGLVWYFYFILSIGIHSVTNITGIILKSWKEL